MSAIDVRVDSFCRRFGLELPILLAPMAGASAPTLSIAVMQAGGLGACGALLMQPDEIAAWADEVRAKGNGPYQLNLWVPDPPPRRDAGQEQLLRAFLGDWGPPPAEDAGNANPPDFAAQCDALLGAGPARSLQDGADPASPSLGRRSGAAERRIHCARRHGSLR